MRTKTVIWISLMIGLIPVAFGQSGAPNLLQFHGKLVNPMTGQPITRPTQIRVQVIQGGTAEEDPTTGRLVFSEQAEVKPDEKGEFDYVIGSNANADRASTTLTAADLNTTQPVFIDLALVARDGSAQALLPRQRMASVGFALQAADAAVDERFVNVDGDTMLGPFRILDSLRVGAGGPTLGAGDASIAGTLQAGNLQTNASQVNSLRVGGGGPTLGAGDAFIADDLQVGASSFLVKGSQGGVVRLTIPGTPADNVGLRVFIQGASFSPGGPAAILGAAPSGFGVFGQSSSSVGVFGQSSNGVGVSGTSSSSTGVVGTSSSFPGVNGRSTSNAGVIGDSASGPGVFVLPLA